LSVYATFDEGPGEQIASNGGWSDFTDWAEDFELPKYEKLLQLLEHGYTTEPGRLADQLAEALEAVPPEESAMSVGERLIEVLRANDTQEAVFVTDGMQ
jgi:hypothetical protein